MDGVNLLGYLTGRKQGRPHDVLYWRMGGRSALRKGDWKLVYTFMGDREMYNLKEDPAELNNLAENDALCHVREDLELELIHWLVRIQDQLPFGRYRMNRAPGNYVKLEGDEPKSTQVV